MFRTQTDELGAFALRIDAGTGDYLVHVAALGYRTFRKRVTAAGPGDSIFVLAVTLDAAVQELPAITVRSARPPRPDRAAPLTVETGAAEHEVERLLGVVAADAAGDLASLAATSPGVQLTPGGISLFGLGTSQLKTTMNGASFRSSEIPGSAATRVRVFSSAYDPSRGGFSAGEVAVSLEPGRIYTDRMSRFSLDVPELQSQNHFTRPAPRFTRGVVDIGGAGELVYHKLYFNGGLRVSHQLAHPLSAGDADPSALQFLGISPDSVAQMAAALSAAGVPLGGRQGAATITRATLLVRLDYRPIENSAWFPTKSTWGLLAYGRFSDAQRVGAQPTTFSTAEEARRGTTGMLQASHAIYWGNDYLTETKSSVTLSGERNTPELRIPAGNILVLSPSETDGTTGALLLFGGSASGGQQDTEWSWESISETQLYARASRDPHRIKVYLESRLEGDGREELWAAPGSFTFASTTDLIAGRPSSFTRQLLPARVSARGWSGAFAVGDLWRKSPRFSLLYGIRAEANRFLNRPPRDAQIEALFDARTDNTPNTVHLSPRLGFTWTYSTGAGGAPRAASTLGSYRRPVRGTVRGGIGEFRNTISSSLLLDALTNSGLPGARSLLTCIGEAAPVPDWAAYQANPQTIPTACASGAPGEVALPRVMYDRSYEPPRSWRANLAWAPVTSALDVELEAIYSLNVGQPGLTDLNFAGTPKFHLSDDGRSVFVSPASIVGRTGTVSPIESRLVETIGPVVSRHSRNRSETRQFTLGVRPALPFDRYDLRAAYTFTRARARQSGFDGTAFGDPRRIEWSRSELAARHQIQIRAAFASNWVRAGVAGVIQSGFPFTPLVLGDVNGDGITGNDRAFIPDPQFLLDTGVAGPMAALLARSSRSVRTCLSRQLGSAARHASCDGPWTAMVNAELRFPSQVTDRLVRTGGRMQARLFFSNLPAAVDRLLHGSRVHGWGSLSRPDPVLLYVRGFDAGSGRFEYQVNSGFGSTRQWDPRFGTPFRVTLDFTVDLSTPYDQQRLDRWLLPGRSGRPGVRLDAEALKSRYERTIRDLFSEILAESDSLLLRPEQEAALRNAQLRYRAQVDTVWAGLAEYLAGLGDDFSGAEALQRANEATEAVYEIARQAARRLPEILDPIQLRLLPDYAAGLYRATEPIRVRRFLSG